MVQVPRDSRIERAAHKGQQAIVPSESAYSAPRKRLILLRRGVASFPSAPNYPLLLKLP